MTAPLESLWKATEERLKNPIVAAFAISWIIYNWRPIAFFLLSNKDVEQKVAMLSEQSSSFWYLFVFPLLSASAYVIAIPWINLYYDKAVFGAEKRKIYADAKKRGVRELADKNLKSENLIVQVDALNAERSIIIAKNTELEKELAKQKKASANYQKQNGSLTDQVLSLTLEKEKQVDELTDQLVKLQTLTSAKTREFEKQISEGEEKKNLHKNNYLESKRLSDSLTETINEMQLTIQEKDRDISAANEKIAELEEGIESFRPVDEKNEELRMALHATQTEIKAEVDKTVSKHSEEIDRIQENMQYHKMEHERERLSPQEYKSIADSLKKRLEYERDQIKQANSWYEKLNQEFIKGTTY